MQLAIVSMVDAGALMLCIPKRLTTFLSREETARHKVITVDGSAHSAPYGGTVEAIFGDCRCFVGALVPGRYWAPCPWRIWTLSSHPSQTDWKTGHHNVLRRCKREIMGRIDVNVSITNSLDRTAFIDCAALVDTGAAYMVLPHVWRERLGNPSLMRAVNCETATQQLVQGNVCGPVEIRIEGFEPVCSEVLFLEMEPIDGAYEPLLGYIVLEQAQAAVDMSGHRLAHVRKVDLK
uniref:Aspartyl protease n=1 Tax=Candidatus Kentrum sp. MB TaxID=2138164 RepID=A0A450XQ32_9GAMM|nr:MAG: hypothetical protein BECKMB1821G_GA0114241_10256 [Candidatus Kentron sp. MB]VFK31377.1 MAG: hypothetical protein BECKMB1821I_GA0114274_10237 [Candidatus Kentron sp. MB]VFK75455.1 MAG: hypothetical protein BECKMB1821H_GA0114242_10237 [Candidatus Kentron sp. MB]